MLPHFIDFNALPWESPAPGVRFKACVQDDHRLRLLEFTPEFSEPEGCLCGHIGYVLEGELELEFDREVYIYRPGNAFVIPAGAAHRHQARVRTGRVRLVIVDDLRA